MEIGITIPLQKFLRWKQPPYGDAPNLLLCWDAHRAEIDGRAFLVLVNSANRFAAIRLMGGVDGRSLGDAAAEAVRLAMAEARLPERLVQAYFEAAGPIAFVKTHGRKPVSGLNRVVDDIRSAVARETDPDARFQRRLTALANATPGRCAAHAGRAAARTAMREDLEALASGSQTRRRHAARCLPPSQHAPGEAAHGAQPRE